MQPSCIWATGMDWIIDIAHLDFAYGPQLALKHIDLRVAPRSTLGLIGPNGAGKSTLIKLLSGIHPKGSYDGELLVDGSPVEFEGIADAGKAGIAVIYQELALVPEMTVAQEVQGLTGCVARPEQGGDGRGGTARPGRCRRST